MKLVASIFYTAHNEAYCSLCGEDLAYPHPKRCPHCWSKFQEDKPEPTKKERKSE